MQTNVGIPQLNLSQDEVFVIPNLGFAAIDMLNKALNLKMDSTRALLQAQARATPADTGVQAYTDRRVTRGST